MGFFDVFNRSKTVENLIKTKLKSYHEISKHFPNLPKIELYIKCIEIRPGFEDRGDEIIKEASRSGEPNYRSIVFWTVFEEMIEPIPPWERENEEEDIEEIHKKINTIIPEDL